MGESWLGPLNVVLCRLIFCRLFLASFLVCFCKGSIAKRDRPTRLDFCQLRIFLLPQPNVRAIKYRAGKKEERERFLLSLFAETTD